MISRGNENFIARHYEWIVAGVGVLALLGAAAYYALSFGADADAAAQAAVQSIDRKKPVSDGIAELDLEPYAATLRQTRTPSLVAAVDATRESFLASERRVKCKCGHVMVSGLETCPKCAAPLVIVNEVDEASKKLDQWKTRYGVDLTDDDKDNDGFTNREEYEAKTDPTDAKDHPDYLDSLKLTLPLKETYVPFVFTKATKIPTGWRCEFFDPKRKDAYGRVGTAFTAVVGEELFLPVSKATGVAKGEPSGYLLKACEKKEELREIQAGSSMKKAVDVSEVTLVRKSDGKVVTLVLQSAKKTAKLTPVDVQATLVYERRTAQTFVVVPGDSITLNTETYLIRSVKPVGKGAEVVLEQSVTGRRKTLKALE